jgi:hypothetical protein
MYDNKSRKNDSILFRKPRFVPGLPGIDIIRARKKQEIALIGRAISDPIVLWIIKMKRRPVLAFPKSRSGDPKCLMPKYAQTGLRLPLLREKM